MNAFEKYKVHMKIFLFVFLGAVFLHNFVIYAAGAWKWLKGMREGMEKCDQSSVDDNAMKASMLENKYQMLRAQNIGNSTIIKKIREEKKKNDSQIAKFRKKINV